MFKDLPLLEPDRSDVVHLFRPYVSAAMRQAVQEQMMTRWIGQGPTVELFEHDFKKKFLNEEDSAVAVSSCTAALHIAYLLALGDQPPEKDDEVIAPVFTCTATNIPWLYLGLKIRWADIDPRTMNPSPESIADLINPRTRAISIVHYGGVPADVHRIREIANQANIPVIEDAAQALGSKVSSDNVGSLSEFTAFSFQAIKHITTGDGGMLTLKDPELAEKAKRLRWFGIDRKGKQNGTWENDVQEVGFKYQMTDIGAAMGIAALDDIDLIISHRMTLFSLYEMRLKQIHGVHLVGSNGVSPGRNSAWLATLIVDEGVERLREKLRTHGFEANPVHFRNDRYSIFDGRATGSCPNMDDLEGKYLCVPLHMEVTEEHVNRICDVVASGW